MSWELICVRVNVWIHAVRITHSAQVLSWTRVLLVGNSYSSARISSGVLFMMDRISLWHHDSAHLRALNSDFLLFVCVFRYADNERHIKRPRDLYPRIRFRITATKSSPETGG